MSPSPTLSAHLCKQIYSSWRELRDPRSQHHPSSPTTTTSSSSSSTATNSAASAAASSYFQRGASPEKRSMDSDRSDSPPVSRQSSNSGWQFGGRR